MRKLGGAIIAAAVVLSLSLTGSASAQTVVGIGVGGGVALPMGEFGDNYKMGITGGAGLFVYPNGGRVGLRAEVGYGQFESELNSEVKFKPLTVMGSLLLPLTTTGSARPYLVGGAGIISDEESALALQGGLGVSIGTGSTRFFVEGKYLTSSKDGHRRSYIPVIAGVSYRFR